jgi:DNA-binding NtrC family response regulator
VEDIPLLANHFIATIPKNTTKTSASWRGPDQTDAKVPLAGKYPGAPAQHRAGGHHDNHSVLQPEDLFMQKHGTSPEKSEEMVSLDHLNIEDVERILIRKALQKHNGHITRAAEELGLTRSSLYRRLEKYGL